jgi:23S rRNA (adenine2503-C2)-methyltransferase
MNALVDFDVASLADRLSASGHPRVHAKRIMLSFYENAGDLRADEMQLGRELTNELTARVTRRRSEILTKRVAADGTVKLLVGFPDRTAVESVLMPSHRPTDAAGCVSSQIGCAMGCDFCASTRNGLTRDLDAGEIVEQFLHLKREAMSLGRRLRTIVFMGMGEPLLNLDNVIAAIRRIAGEGMGAIGWRQVTVSTVGIVPGIDALAEADLNVQLALSLHAPDDETRSRLVPMNRRYKVADIMDAARRFAAKTRRIPNIEYCLLARVNDSDAQARQLATLMNGFRAHVNLIPYNAIGSGITGTTYTRPSDVRIDSFITILRSAGVVTHLRRPRGDDVAAACGQLVSMSAKSGDVSEG